MNTPKPCYFCKHIYVNCMQKDNPDYKAECWVDKYVPCKDEPLEKYNENKIKEYLNICNKFESNQ